MTEQEELKMYLDEQTIQELREERRKEEERAFAEYIEEVNNGLQLLSSDVLPEMFNDDGDGY